MFSKRAESAYYTKLNIVCLPQKRQQFASIQGCRWSGAWGQGITLFVTIPRVLLLPDSDWLYRGESPQLEFARAGGFTDVGNC